MYTKITKKVVAVTLVTALAASTGIAVKEDTSKAAMKKKVTITQGKEVKLNAGASAKWSSSNDNVAHCQKSSGKSIKVLGIKKGTATITATVGSKKQKCKVTVKTAKAGTVLYNFAKSTDPDNHPPFVANYSTFKYDSFKMWLCPASFYGEKTYIAPDYRGRKLKVSMVVKNTGKRDLPELGVCFNFTKSSTDGSYPFAYHASAKPVKASVKKNKNHKHCTYKVGKIKKGKDLKINFTFTIPKDAINGDTDDKTGANYPIMMYIPNLKDSSPYKDGDEITVKKCVIKLA